MTPKQIEQLVQHYGISYRQRGEEERETRTVDDDERDSITSYYSDRLEDAMFDLLRNDYRRIRSTADELLTEHKYTLPTDSQDYQRLCRRLLQEQQRVFKTEIARLSTLYVGSTCGLVGAVALWFWSSSFAAACVFLATAGLIGEQPKNVRRCAV
jgi:hypothetical protein